MVATVKMAPTVPLEEPLPVVAPRALVEVEEQEAMEAVEEEEQEEQSESLPTISLPAPLL